MPFREPSFWSLVIGAGGVIVGWLVKGAANEARLRLRIEQQEREISRMSERIKALEAGSLQTASALATITTEIQGIGRTLTRLEARLDGKADK